MSEPESNDGHSIAVRDAHEADLDDIEQMIDDFVHGHPAEHHPRSRAALRSAYFGDAPVAHFLIVERRERIVG
jgi:hypothetical protein